MDVNDILKQARRQSQWVVASAAVAFAAAMLVPPLPLFDHGSPGVVVMHLLLELFAVIVSCLVVVTAWYRPSDHDVRIAHALVFGFALVACCDLVHAMSYVGMPDFLSHSSTPKAIYFWLMARSAELLTMGLVALQVRLPGGRGGAMALALASGLLVFAVGTWHLDWFPETFVTGQGVTAFKANYEVLLAVGNLVGALYFFLRHRAAPDPRDVYFAASCLVMGMSELMFTSYVDVSDFSNVFGHLLKVLAYALIFKATFYLSIQAPHSLLQRSEAELRNTRAELAAVLSYMPAGVFRLDSEGYFQYVNDTQAVRLGIRADQVVGRHFYDVATHLPHELLSRAWQQVIGGEQVSFKSQANVPDVGDQQSTVTLGPQRAADGRIIGVIGVSLDVTEQARLQRQLLTTLEQVSELKWALDAHAIVAVTDAEGRIVEVNNKFCQVSQYPRDALLGQTHRVVYSGYHPHAFFAQLWATVVSGEAWSGEICNRAQDGSHYWVQTTIVPIAGSEDRPRQYIAISADITPRKLIELEMQQMAFQDPLTKLPNRRLLMDRLTQSLLVTERTRQHGALLFIDLDHFKEVNDSLGHQQGDELLKVTAQRLTDTVRQSDTVCRLGGDEFLVQLNDLGEEPTDATAAAGEIGAKILAALNLPYFLGAAEIICPPSVGVVMYRGGELSADALIKQADIALYQAKDAGRNNLCFFDPKIQHAFQERMALESDLRYALQNQELLLHYQPIVDVDRQVIGVEALLRWQHPSRGLVSPAAFIPIAEKSGLIVPIGEWVLQTAGQLLRRWSDDPDRCRWTVAVNVSARQFRHPQFVSTVLDTLRDQAIGAGRLKLEITESTLLADVDDAIHNMHALRRHGVQFAIDDFGTGYSSLTYLKRLPIGVLKIDRSFVSDLDWSYSDRAIAKTIIELGDNLQLDIVAEGVETQEQFDILRQNGCRQFQGYLFGKPQPMD